MNRSIWLIKKNQIFVIIKKISDHYGGDDVQWLREYCRELIDSNKDDIQNLLNYYWEFEQKLKYLDRYSEKKAA